MSAFITCADSLKSALSRLCDCNDSTMFYNPAGIMFLIRGMTDEDDSRSIDIGVLGGELMDRCMKHETDVSEEGNIYVLQEFVVDNDTIDDIKKTMNEFWEWTVCPCNEYLIKHPEATMCYVCEMTCGGQTPEEFCPICHDHGHTRWMIQTPCCKQNMHRTCHRLWKTRSRSCAICRQESPCDL